MTIDNAIDMTYVDCFCCNGKIKVTNIRNYGDFKFNIDNPNGFPKERVNYWPMCYLQISYKDNIPIGEEPFKIIYCSEYCFNISEGYIRQYSVLDVRDINPSPCKRVKR